MGNLISNCLSCFETESEISEGIFDTEEFEPTVDALEDSDDTDSTITSRIEALFQFLNDIRIVHSSDEEEFGILQDEGVFKEDIDEQVFPEDLDEQVFPEDLDELDR